LERYIEDFDVEASADFIFEDEIESSQVLGWSVPESSNFDVVASDRSTVSLAFSIEVQAEFIAGISFSVRDAIDRDYVPMGSTSAHKTEKLLVPIVATLHRDELLAQG
jgi:hypothetical protein